MAKHRVYFGRGDQPLRTVPHIQGRPQVVASATYSISNLRYSIGSTEHVVAAAGTVATIDTASTSLANMAGPEATNARTIRVASTAGFSANRSYALTSTSGVVELVRIATVVSGTELLAAAEIRGKFLTGSTLKGCELTATFPAAQADDVDHVSDDLPWLIVWDIPGFAPLKESIHLERGEEAILATLEDLTELDPMLAKTGNERIDSALALSRAHRDVRTDLQLAGASESDMLLGPIGRDCVCYRAAFLMTHHSNDEAEMKKAEFYHERYQHLLSGLMIGSMRSEVVALDKATVTTTKRNPAAMFKRYGE